MVDLLERLECLLVVEGQSYRTLDYLAPSHQQGLQQQYQSDPGSFDLQSAFTPTASSNSSSQSGINEVWREKICEWSYQVIDHFDFSREVVSVSIHYLDRFLATTPVNKKLFQLVAMTALYLAIKINEPGNLSMKSMIELSRGYFSPQQMAEMEMIILRSLAWKLHPPTAYCFCKHVLFLLPQSTVSLETRYEILELARFLTELCVIDYYFVVHKASDVALAALLNSMETIAGADAALLQFEQELLRVEGGLNPRSPQVQECRARLHVLYTQGGYSRPEILGNAAEPRDEANSPICVAEFGGIPQQPQQANSRNAHDDPAMAMDADENFDVVNHPQQQQDNHIYKVLAEGVHDLTKNVSPVAPQEPQLQQLGYDYFAAAAEPLPQDPPFDILFAEDHE